MERWAIKFAPAVFVFLWSTGFIGTKYGLPYAEPMTFLAVRFLLVLALLLPLVFAFRVKWPRSAGAWGHVAIVGVAVHVLYLGGIFTAMDRGLPAGVTALIVSLQPILAAVVAGPLLGERVTARQVAGLALGFLGVVLVLSESANVLRASTRTVFEGFSVYAVVPAFVALLGISGGTLYQKRFASHLDLRASIAIQYMVATSATATLAAATESWRIDWTMDFIFALSYLVCVMSMGAVLLLMFLIRRGEAARISSLFYLVPPTTALLAFVVLGETMGPIAMFGLLVTAVGVAMVVSAPATSRKSRGV